MHLFSSCERFDFNSRIEFYISSFCQFNVYNQDIQKNIDVVSQNKADIAVLKLLSDSKVANITNNITSDSNLVLSSDKTIKISNEARIIAENILLITYRISYVNHASNINLILYPEDSSIINHGVIEARQNGSSAIATYKLVNKGNISDNIDADRLVGTARSLVIYEGENNENTGSSFLDFVLGAFSFFTDALTD